MNPLFTYLIKASISLALLYLLFRLAMRNESNHSMNRFLLLGILIASSVIPFLNIQFFYEELPLRQISAFREIMFQQDVLTSEQVALHNDVESNSLQINPWIISYYFTAVILLLRLLISAFRVVQLIRKGEKIKEGDRVFVITDEKIQPFTFLNKIILSEKDYKKNKNIVGAHEHAHIKYLHAIDLMVCEVFVLVHFFNPFVWFLRHDLKLIHEYQADQAVLNKGIDAQKYQLLVLEKAVGERRFAMANHFTQKPILKRLKMMTKKNKRKWAGVRILLFVPLLALLLQAFARPELITSTTDFVPVKSQNDQAEAWLQNWTKQKIGKGFFQPKLESIDAPRMPNNVLVILMNARDQYLVEGEYVKRADLKSVIVNYLEGVNPDGGRGPDFVEKNIPGIGKHQVSKGMIHFLYDNGSSKEAIDYTLRSAGEACLEVRNQKSRKIFNKNYFELDDEQQEAINQAIPAWLYLPKPKKAGPPPPPPPPPKFLVKLYKDKITIFDDEVSIQELYSRANEFSEKSKGSYIAKLFVYEDVPEERIAKVKDELRKAKIKRINYSSVNK